MDGCLFQDDRKVFCSQHGDKIDGHVSSQFSLTVICCKPPFLFCKNDLSSKPCVTKEDYLYAYIRYQLKTFRIFNKLIFFFDYGPEIFAAGHLEQPTIKHSINQSFDFSLL